MEILNTLGRGLLEKPYENALIVEFGLRNIPVSQQYRFDVLYKNELFYELIIFVSIRGSCQPRLTHQRSEAKPRWGVYRHMIISGAPMASRGPEPADTPVLSSRDVAVGRCVAQAIAVGAEVSGRVDWPSPTRESSGRIRFGPAHPCRRPPAAGRRYPDAPARFQIAEYMLQADSQQADEIMTPADRLGIGIGQGRDGRLYGIGTL